MAHNLHGCNVHDVNVHATRHDHVDDLFMITLLCVHGSFDFFWFFFAADSFLLSKRVAVAFTCDLAS